MKVDVHCSVDDCHYWKSGNYCNANKILVTSDALAAREPDNVDSPMAKQLPATPTNNCMETCCKTFVKKGSNQIGVDGVTRQS